MMRRGLHLLITTISLLVLTACASPRDGSNEPSAAAAGNSRVTGTVTYLERIALPPDTRIKVMLADVSRADARAITIGEQLIETNGRQVPFAFEIAYDPRVIDPRHTYAIQARIEQDGRLRFISDRRHAVITRGAPIHVDLVVRPINGTR